MRFFSEQPLVGTTVCIYQVYLHLPGLLEIILTDARLNENLFWTTTSGNSSLHLPGLAG